MVEIQILLVEPAPGARSRRALELQHAAARSHASRVVHNRNKRKKGEVIQFEGDDNDAKRERDQRPSISRRIPSSSSRVVLAQRTSHNSSNQPSWTFEEDNISLQYNEEQILASSRPPLGSFLGQGKQDPFESYDGSRLPRPLVLVLEDGASPSPIIIKGFPLYQYTLAICSPYKLTRLTKLVASQHMKLFGQKCYKRKGTHSL